MLWGLVLWEFSHFLSSWLNTWWLSSVSAIDLPIRQVAWSAIKLFGITGSSSWAVVWLPLYFISYILVFLVSSGSSGWWGPRGPAPLIADGKAPFYRFLPRGPTRSRNAISLLHLWRYIHLHFVVVDDERIHIERRIQSVCAHWKNLLCTIYVHI